MQTQQLVAGTTLNFLTAGGDYPASDGWVLTYYLALRSGTGAFTLVAAAEGADHRVTVAAAATAGWTAGTYSWESRVARAGEVYRIANGQIDVLANIAVATGAFDNRSAAEIALANVEAMLSGKATSGTRRYRIGDRELESYATTDLLVLRDKLAMDVRRERRASALAQGLPDPAKTYVRLVRP